MRSSTSAEPASPRNLKKPLDPRPERVAVDREPAHEQDGAALVRHAVRAVDAGGLVDVAALRSQAAEQRRFMQERRAAGDSRYAGLTDDAIDAEISASLRSRIGAERAALVEKAQSRRRAQGQPPLASGELRALTDPQGVYDADKARSGSKLVRQLGPEGARPLSQSNEVTTGPPSSPRTIRRT